MVVRANDGYAFHAVLDSFHVNEKWFYFTKPKQSYNLTPERPEPLRSWQSKRFIEKIMLLAAVTRPRYDQLSQTMFDEKIEI